MCDNIQVISCLTILTILTIAFVQFSVPAVQGTVQTSQLKGDDGHINGDVDDYENDDDDPGGEKH